MATVQKVVPIQDRKAENHSESQAFLDLQQYLCDHFPLSSHMVAQINRYVDREFEPRKNGQHK